MGPSGLEAQSPTDRRRLARALQVLALLVPLSIGGYFGGRLLWASYHLRAAERALAKDKLLDAQEHLRQCLKVRKHDPQVVLLAARTARRAGLLDEARGLLDACENLLGTTPEVAVERVLLSVREGVLSTSDEILLWEGVRQNPAEAVPILEVLVPFYLQRYQFQSAIRGLQLWLEARPTAVRPLILRAQIYLAMGNVGKAVEDARQAVKLDPESDEARLLLANYLLSDAKIKEATGHYEYLLQQHPDNTTALLGLARCHYHEGKVQEAERLLKRLLTIEPGTVIALCELGRIALVDNRPKEAETWLLEAYRRDPYERDALLLLASCYRNQKRQDVAEVYQTKFNKVDADLSRLKELTKETLEAPQDPELRYEAGVICLRNGQAEEGLRWLSGALQIDPQHGPTHQALADYYEKAGQPELAARHRQEAAGHEEKPAGPGTSRDK